MTRGSRWQFGEKQETRASPCRAVRGVATRGPTLKRVARLLAFHSVLFSHFPQFGPHSAPVVSFAHISRSGTPIDDSSSPTRSTSKQLPTLTIFFSFLNCWNVLHWLFSSLCLFALFLRSRIPIDNPFSPTRHTSKRLPILTLLSSFERLDWLLSFCVLYFFLCTSAFIFFDFTCYCMP